MNQVQKSSANLNHSLMLKILDDLSEKLFLIILKASNEKICSIKTILLAHDCLKLIDFLEDKFSSNDDTINQKDVTINEFNYDELHAENDWNFLAVTAIYDRLKNILNRVENF